MVLYNDIRINTKGKQHTKVNPAHLYLMVRNTRNALSALIALNIRSSLKMAATSKEPTFCTISGSRKSTMVKRTMRKSREKNKTFNLKKIKSSV